MRKETFKTGDYIRAYDFKPCLGRGDNFVEGQIISIEKPANDYHYYLIECTRDICDDLIEMKYSRVGEKIKVPCKTSNDYPGRVINLTRI